MRNSHTSGPTQGFCMGNQISAFSDIAEYGYSVSLKAYAIDNFHKFTNFVCSLEAENILFFPTSMKPLSLGVCACGTRYYF